MGLDKSQRILNFLSLGVDGQLLSIGDFSQSNFAMMMIMLKLLLWVFYRKNLSS